MVRLSPTKWWRALLGASLALTLLSLAGQYSRFVLHHDRLLGLVRLFDVDAEANVPTWFQSMTLLGCALLLALIAAERQAAGDRFVRHWRGLAALFAFMSLDEVASLHERLALPVGWLHGDRTLAPYTWTAPAVVILVLLAAPYFGFVRALPRRSRHLFLISAMVYVGGAVGMEALGGLYADLFGGRHFGYTLFPMVEELMEMLGMTTFAFALLDFIATHHASMVLRVERDAPPLALVTPLTLPDDRAAGAPAPGSPGPRFGRRP